MNTITSSSLQPLIDYEGGYALTIYMPTHRHPSPPNMREDQIRFKNAIRTAEEELSKAGADETDISAIIEKLEAKQEDMDFWRRTSRGTVFFVNKEDMTVFSLPFECDEHLYAGSHFDVGLAMAALSYDQPYLLLTLANHDPKLYKGDISGLELVETDLPKSPEDALNIDEMFINSNTVRGVSAGGNAVGSGRFATHGQGDSQEAGNEERLKFFRIIDRIILDSEHCDPEVPLLLAGIDNEVAEYRDVSSYPLILSGHVGGIHTTTQPQDLHKLAWPIVNEEVNQHNQEALLSRFNEVRGAQKSSVDPKDIQNAADAGRVDTLMVGAITATHDTVSDEEGAIVKLSMHEWYESLQVNELVRKVLAQGGKLVGFDGKLLPEKAVVAAIYRY